MKLQLNKKKLKNLSKDAAVLPADMTPAVGGGVVRTEWCNSTYVKCVPASDKCLATENCTQAPYC
jgi:hypothetical protein